jgi:hypothetical protein
MERFRSFRNDPIPFPPLSIHMVIQYLKTCRTIANRCILVACSVFLATVVCVVVFGVWYMADIVLGVDNIWQFYLVPRALVSVAIPTIEWWCISELACIWYVDTQWVPKYFLPLVGGSAQNVASLRLPSQITWKLTTLDSKITGSMLHCKYSLKRRGGPNGCLFRHVEFGLNFSVDINLSQLK